MDNRTNRIPHLAWHSVGFKVFFFYATSMIAVILFSGYLFYQRSAAITEEHIGKIALQSIQQANIRIDNIFEEYKDRALMILGNTDIQKAMTSKMKDPYESLEYGNKIQTFLTKMFYSKKDTKNIYFIGNNGFLLRYSTLGGSDTSNFEWKDYKEAAWYKRIWTANGTVVLLGNSEPIQSDGTSDNKVFLFGAAIRDVDHGYERIGVMVYEVSSDQIQDILSQVAFNGKGTTFLSNENREIMVSSDGSERSDFLERMASDRKTMMINDELNAVPWTVVSLLPRHELLKELDSIGWYMVYTSIFVILVAVLISFLVARYIYRPTYLLLRFMRKAQEGRFTDFISEKRNDEFGQIFLGFNNMIVHIKKLIDELYMQEIIKKDMQFKVLGSQINTHFLYNTLNDIYWMSKMNKSKEISVMVRSLSDYFQLNLSEGEEEITIREIVRLLENYVAIQQIRYRDKIDVSITMAEEIGECKLVKYLFQPIVENAIYHGLEKKQSRGKLTIRFEENDATIRFLVTDDGVGMSRSKLEQINQMFKDKEMSPAGNFALLNIQAQIHLKYGDESSLAIESEEGVGTTVLLTLPKRG